jgi:hypothetical protein
VFTHASNPRILLQPEAFGLSQPLYRLHRRLRRDLNDKWWYWPRLVESLQQVVRGASAQLRDGDVVS